MNKEQYISKSKKAELPNRCTLIGKCDRWAQTIFFYHFYDSKYYKAREWDYLDELIKSGLINQDFVKNRIEIQAEAPEFLRSNELVSYRFMCPEVNLFDSEHCLPFAKDTASVSGEWDDVRERNKFKNHQEKHYTECLEFSQFIFSHLDKKRISKYYDEKRKRRIPISKKLRIEIFQRDKHTCQYCGRMVSDGIKLEIDHKVPIAEGGTDDYDNLVTACSECNSGKSNKIHNY